jgi:predicted nucleotidyltransferase
VEKWPEFRPSGILARLAAGGVDFVVIGGYAAIAHGSAQQTNDIDVCFAQDDANLRVLGQALVDMQARLRGVDEDVPFVPDERTLRHVELFTLDTLHGPIDLLAVPEGVPDYPTLRGRADRVEVAGVAVLVASLEDLLSMKRAAGRDKDRIAVEELEAIRRLRKRVPRQAQTQRG